MLLISRTSSLHFFGKERECNKINVFFFVKFYLAYGHIKYVSIVRYELNTRGIVVRFQATKKKSSYLLISNANSRSKLAHNEFGTEDLFQDGKSVVA